MHRRQKVQVHLWRTGEGGERLYALFQRAPAKGDYWQPVTGNVDEGETPEQTALREAREEAGVDAARSALSPRLWVHDWSREGQNFEEHVFALRCDGAECTISGEHRAFEWLRYGEALMRLKFEGNRRGLAFAESWLRSNSAS